MSQPRRYEVSTEGVNQADDEHLATGNRDLAWGMFRGAVGSKVFARAYLMHLLPELAGVEIPEETLVPRELPFFVVAWKDSCLVACCNVQTLDTAKDLLDWFVLRGEQLVAVVWNSPSADAVPEENIAVEVAPSVSLSLPSSKKKKKKTTTKNKKKTTTKKREREEKEKEPEVIDVADLSLSLSSSEEEEEEGVDNDKDSAAAAPVAFQFVDIQTTEWLNALEAILQKHTTDHRQWITDNIELDKARKVHGTPVQTVWAKCLSLEAIHWANNVASDISLACRYHDRDYLLEQDESGIKYISGKDFDQSPRTPAKDVIKLYVNPVCPTCKQTVFSSMKDRGNRNPLFHTRDAEFLPAGSSCGWCVIVGWMIAFSKLQGQLPVKNSLDYVTRRIIPRKGVSWCLADLFLLTSRQAHSYKRYRQGKRCAPKFPPASLSGGEQDKEQEREQEQEQQRE